MVAAVVVTLVALLAARAGMATVSQLGSSETSPHWQTYHDPFDLFTVRLPPGWTAHIEPATTWYIDNNGTEKVSEEMLTFDNPSQGTGSAHLWVVADPIKDAFDRQYYCRNASDLHPFSPMSLSSMAHARAVRLFTTNTASFQIDVAIPDILVPWHSTPLELTPLPTATPLPATWIASDQAELQMVLTSFQPTDPKPLSC
jgi:hypothetical protein